MKHTKHTGVFSDSLQKEVLPVCSLLGNASWHLRVQLFNFTLSEHWGVKTPCISSIHKFHLGMLSVCDGANTDVFTPTASLKSLVRLPCVSLDCGRNLEVILADHGGVEPKHSCCDVLCQPLGH